MNSSFRTRAALVAAAVALVGADAAALGQASVVLQGRIRDFNDTHPDFEEPGGNAVTPGLLSANLGGDGKPSFVAAPGTGSISTAANFGQWYNDTAGVNVGAPFSITLTGANPTLVAFESTAFFPLDGQLLGNQGRPHNYHFTVQLGGTFTYRAGLGQRFLFRGDDDAWVYINRRLAIDLGGLHQAATREVILDQIAAPLGLVDGQSFPLDAFFAERKTVDSTFIIWSSLGPQVPEPATLGGALMAATAALVRRRR